MRWKAITLFVLAFTSLALSLRDHTVKNHAASLGF